MAHKYQKAIINVVTAVFLVLKSAIKLYIKHCFEDIVAHTN